MDVIMTTLEQIRGIYQKLEDTASRDIFNQRLLYSLSGDYRYINEMISLEMKRHGREDIMAELLSWAEAEGKEVVIFGAGFAGMQIANVLGYQGRQVRCFVDNDETLQGSLVGGLQVCAPGMLRELKECRVVIGTNSCVAEIKEQLRGMGILEEWIFTPQKTWWLGPQRQYFDLDIIRPHDKENFIDAGAFDGEDSQAFIKWCGGDYKAIHLFEPDADNFKKAGLAALEDQRITMYNEGLWSSSGELKFLSGNREKSVITMDGDVSVKVTTIDEKLNGEAVTLIKMDIEGSEREALKGAEKTIRKYRPRLAVCVYHKPEDIIEIPQKILELNGAYKLFLRHYSYMHTETVLYAI